MVSRKVLLFVAEYKDRSLTSVESWGRIFLTCMKLVLVGKKNKKHARHLKRGGDALRAIDNFVKTSKIPLSDLTPGLEADYPEEEQSLSFRVARTIIDGIGFAKSFR